MTVLDAEADFPDLKLDAGRGLERLEPFGFGNPSPLFLTRNVAVLDVRTLGVEAEHVKFRLEQRGLRFDALGWRKAEGLPKKVYWLILLGCTTRNAETDRIDHALVKWLAGIGIPVALILHGYVGFLFGSIKANAWWSTPLMFVIFISSAIVSGIAVLIFLYQFVSWEKGIRVDDRTLSTMGKFLWGFMILAVVLERTRRNFNGC